ncbi:MAG TPA: wax ester/triacylglycerol synthase domain-containing protein [Acidimicrobiales bacterium]|nr:wax ester/triacylglycerol synthase domain-containing protein [Acidimicrobiales bacterium]
MSANDTLLWTIARDPVLRTAVVAVLMLDRSPPWEDVQERVRALTQLVPRFRSRVQPASPLGWGRPVWVEDEGFDLDVHLRRMVAPPPATFRTVLDLAQVMGTTAFDPELPLWEAVVVEGVEGGRAALVVKLHHAVADGVGGIAVILHLLDRHRVPRHGNRTSDATSIGDSSPNDGSGPGNGGMGTKLRKGFAELVPAWRRVLDATRHAAANPVAQINRTRAMAESVGRLLAPARRPFSPLMTARSLGRRFEVLDLSTDLLRQAAAVTGGTLNDVLLTGVLGGLRRYHLEHGIEVEQLRVLMPVNVRGDSDAVGGNHFVPARFALPVLADPVELLRRVHEIAGSWKHAPGLGMSNVLAGALDLLPAPLSSALWGSMLKGDDFVVTNVPGPPFETYLVGAHVEQLFGFAPASGAALNVALLTPAGRSCVGVTIDTAAIPDAALMRSCLQEGLDEVVHLAPDSRQVAEA